MEWSQVVVLALFKGCRHWLSGPFLACSHHLTSTRWGEHHLPPNAPITMGCQTVGPKTMGQVTMVWNCLSGTQTTPFPFSFSVLGILSQSQKAVKTFTSFGGSKLTDSTICLAQAQSLYSVCLDQINMFKADRISHNIFFSIYLSFALGRE